MADSSSQLGTSTGSSNVNNNIYGPIGTFNQHNHGPSTSSANIVIDYYPAPVSTFSGRSEELGELKTMFTRHQVVALVGMGGLGKTQLSRKYVLDNEADYKYKYWLESETHDKLTNSFKKFAKKLHIEFDNIDDEVVNDVYKKIQAVPTILVFDNVEKPEHVYAYLPSRVNLPSGVTIHVLVTSRWAEWTCDKHIQCYKLQPLNILESLEIFEEKFGKSWIKKIQNEWKELAEMLGCLPLALQVATSYIYKRNKHNSGLPLVLADYMKQLKEGSDRLLNDPLIEYGNRSVYASMLLTLNQLKNETGDEWKFAVTLINATAYMNPDRIDKKWLLKLLDNEDETWKLDDALIILTEYSLFNRVVIRGENTIYSVHRIIQSSMRHNQTLMGTADKYYIRLLKYAFAENYYFRHVLQYINERASAVAEYYKHNPSPRILEYLIENKATAAMEAAMKLSKNQIQIAMKEHDLLYRAVASRDLKMIQLLCKYGADINQLCRKEGEPPLHRALKNSNVDIATWLLENNAAPALRDREGSTALHVASRWANHKMVPIIIKTDRAVVNETDNEGRTPLLAIGYCDEEDLLSTIHVLVESGANIMAVDKDGNTVLHLAARYACASTVSLILQRNKHLTNIKNKDGNTALHVIPYDNPFIDDECIRSIICVLVESGVDLTRLDEWGNTVLHLAAEGARAKSVSLILQRNKDLLNIVNEEGQTALHILANEIYNYVEEKRRSYFYVDIEAECANDEFNYFKETARVLIMNGLSLDTTDKKGRTSLDTVLDEELKYILCEVARECN